MSDELLPEQVLDPSDYNRTKRFEEIHAARRRVVEEIAEMDISADGAGYAARDGGRVASLVALYALELVPLIDRAEDTDHGEHIPDDVDFESLREFGYKLGGLGETDERPPGLPTLTRIYAAGNEFYASVGMDLELDEGARDAEFEYDDLLEVEAGGEKPTIEGDD